MLADSLLGEKKESSHVQGTAYSSEQPHGASVAVNVMRQIVVCQVIVVREFMGQKAPERILWRQVEEIFSVLYVSIRVDTGIIRWDSLGLCNECNDHLFKLQQ